MRPLPPGRVKKLSLGKTVFQEEGLDTEDFSYGALAFSVIVWPYPLIPLTRKRVLHALGDPQ
jgi:hypothetical protein